MPDNKALALGRLQSLVKKMKKNPKLIQKYDEIIKDQLKMGVIEQVKSESNSSTRHYIPHHAVVNPTKEVQVGKDQEKAQSEKDSHSKNEGGKKPN